MSRIGAADLYRQHAAWVARFLARIGAERQDIDDLVQEVFLVAHRKGGYIAGPASAKTWLAEIAQYAKGTAARSRRRRRERPDEGAVAAAVNHGATPYDTAASSESLSRLPRLLASLGDEMRTVFILFELEHESLTAIAAGLRVPLGTVCSRLDTARRTIRKAYEKLERDPGRGAPGAAGRSPLRGVT